jgi:hypothetical protein
MKLESGLNGAASSKETPESVIEKFDSSRIEADTDSFRGLYSDYHSDMERVDNLSQIYDDNSTENQFGKVAEALVFSLLNKHPINEHVTFRPTNLYDDYFHGADLLVEPNNALVQSVASIDITTNQEDIKGVQRRGGPLEENRPVGLEGKLLRTQRYTDHLANFDSTQARNLNAWLESGGLHEQRNSQTESYFKQAERLFLMKYYKTPDFAPEPGREGFVIGGPQTVISLDTLFINKALQGNKQAEDLAADLSVLEFAYCIQAEQEYLDAKVRSSKSRNIFFDTHYSKVKAWSTILNRPELRSMFEDMVGRNQHSREFREQLGYYGKTFQKIYAK